MEVAEATLDELVTLSLRSLRRAPTGLVAVLSGAASALRGDLVAAFLVPATGSPEAIASGGIDAPGLSQRTGEDHIMLDKLVTGMEAKPVPHEMRSGKWVEYPHVAAVASSIDEQTSCVVIAGGDHPVDLQILQRVSAPVTVLVNVIAQDRISRKLRHHAVEADQELSLLLAGLHHDLRTPLTAILGSAQTLMAREDQVSPETRHELLDSIVRQADRLTRMVGDALDRDRHRGGPVRTTRVSLRHLGERAAAAAMMGRAGVVTVEAPDIEICTDPDRLERALLNLIDNALKYSPEGSPVYLIAEPNEGWARFTVADKGPGVAHDVLPRLFTPYVSDPARADGTGLGLTSAKKVVEYDLHGLLSYSRHDGWTRFVINVPNDEATSR